jgi:threonine aldolase
MKGLASDNHSGVHPLILKALSSVNHDHQHSYGLDEASEQLDSLIKDTFGSEYDGFHVFNGTAANVLSLKALVKSHESVFCSELSHLNVDECGAPEFHLGSKIIALPDHQGKINLKDLEEKLIRFGDQHFSQPKALSITQPTELGTCYSLKELSEIKSFCKSHNLFLHIDGARLSNASYHLKTPLKEIVSGADAISFGGTKNGLMGGELVLLKKEFSKDFKFIRKQLMQLPSKTRFLSEQFITYLSDDLYLKIAKHSCDLASLLHEKILKIGLKPTAPSDSNAVFVCLPKHIIKPLKKRFFFYVWNPKTFEVRLMTSFDSTKEEIEEFCNHLQELMKNEERNPLL